MKLTIGFSTRDDSSGAWMTINSLLAHHSDALAKGFEIVIIDNSPAGSDHANQLEAHVKNVKEIRYVRAIGPESSCLYKQRLFDVAQGEIVLCCDSHVLFDSGSIQSLLEHFEDHPDSTDLIMGPCLHRSGSILGTNQMIYESEPYKVPENADVQNGVVWRGGSCGVWVNDPRGQNRSAESFEIMQQGTGAFACRRDAWPGFHRSFVGHGGNETYLMERFRERGSRVLCLPAFRWIHRFLRVGGAPYSLSWEHRVRNYLTGFADLDRCDLYQSAVAHLKKHCPKTTEKVSKAVSQPRGLRRLLQERLNSSAGEVPGQIPEALFAELKRRIKPGMNTLEFGSGLSTLLFDQLLTNHTAIEHSAKWSARVRNRIKSADTKVIESPIEPISKWYEWRPDSSEQYDLILIDGPPGQQFLRSGCLHYLSEIMAPSATILIDDTHREKDAALSSDIAQMYGFSSQRIRVGGRAFDILTRTADAKVYSDGPGAELKRILKERFGMEASASCGCNGKMREMNYRGVEWCRANMETIVGWLMDGSQKWVAEQNGAKATWVKLVPDLAKRVYIKNLVSEAIQTTQ